MKLPHYIFDFGGVVFHWKPTELLARVLPGHAHSPAAAEYWKAQFFQGYEGDWGAFDAGLLTTDELVDRISSRTVLTPDEVRAVVDAVPPSLTPLSGTVQLIDDLRQAGHRLFFLSNMPAPYADYLQQQHAFLSAFEDGVFSAHVQVGKPHPQIFQVALERFGVPAADCVFIDDHPANIEVAQSLGLQTVLCDEPADLPAKVAALTATAS